MHHPHFCTRGASFLVVTGRIEDVDGDEPEQWLANEDKQPHPPCGVDTHEQEDEEQQEDHAFPFGNAVGGTQVHLARLEWVMSALQPEDLSHDAPPTAGLEAEQHAEEALLLHGLHGEVAPLLERTTSALRDRRPVRALDVQGGAAIDGPGVRLHTLHRLHPALIDVGSG